MVEYTVEFELALLADKFAIWILLGSAAFLIYRYCRKRLFDFVLALALAGAVSEGLKNIINKPRPQMIAKCIHFGECVDNIVGPVFEGGSFPSTHTTLAFTAVSFYLFVCHKGGRAGEEEKLPSTPKKRFVIILLMFLGSLVGFLRVLIGAHFPIDIFAGIILGIIIAAPFRYYDVTSRRIK